MQMENVRPGEDDQMLDRDIDQLGKYFVRARIREEFGFTFEEFLMKVESGAWAARFTV